MVGVLAPITGCWYAAHPATPRRRGRGTAAGTTLAWSEFASTCGFLARASQNDPCFKCCCCVRRKWRALAGMNMLVWGCSKKTTDSSFAALAACHTCPDRGAQGRALRIDLARLGLYNRDRLEPSGEVLVRRGSLPFRGRLSVAFTGVHCKGQESNHHSRVGFVRDTLH